MVGNALVFLRYNTDEIFKNLLAIEGHLRYAEKIYTPQNLSCIVKHAADAEGHADEAISHAAELGIDTSNYRKLRNMIRDFRIRVQTEPVNPDELIKEIRNIRRFFESFNPDYDISKCAVCGVSLGSILSKAESENPGESPANPGEEYETALESINPVTEYSVVGGEALTWRDTGAIVLSQHMAAAILKAMDRIDGALGKGGANPVERPSTWIALLGGLALILIPRAKRLPTSVDIFMTTLGGYMTTYIWRYIG